MLTIGQVSTNLCTNNYQKQPSFKAVSGSTLEAEMEQLTKILEAANSKIDTGRKGYISDLLNDIVKAVFRKKRARLVETLKRLFNEQETSVQETQEMLTQLKEQLNTQKDTLVKTTSEQAKTITERDNTILNLENLNNQKDLQIKQLNEKCKDLEDWKENYINKSGHIVESSEFGKFKLSSKGLRQYMALTSKLEADRKKDESIKSSISSLEDSLRELRRYNSDGCGPNRETIKKILDFKAERTVLSTEIGACEAKIKLLKSTGEIPD